MAAEGAVGCDAGWPAEFEGLEVIGGGLLHGHEAPKRHPWRIRLGHVRLQKEGILKKGEMTRKCKLPALERVFERQYALTIELRGPVTL